MLVAYQEPAKLFNKQQWLGNLPKSNLIDLNKLSTGNVQYLLQKSINFSVLDKCPRCYAIASSLDSSLLSWYTIALLTWEETAAAHQTIDWIQAFPGDCMDSLFIPLTFKTQPVPFVFVPKPPRQILQHPLAIPTSMG